MTLPTNFEYFHEILVSLTTLQYFNQINLFDELTHIEQIELSNLES